MTDIAKINQLRKELQEAKSSNINESKNTEIEKIEENLKAEGCGTKRICD